MLPTSTVGYCFYIYGMPLIRDSNYKRPWYLFNGHLETIIPSVFYKEPPINYVRERLELPDGDFVDLDWLKKEGSKKLVILSHGLEGNSARHYMMRPAKYFFENNWNVLAWNCRSCSGEMNRKARFYHHGDTPDLESVIHSTLTEGFESIVLLGFSMGGSMTLKYLGEERQRPEQIKGAVVFSVPCNLKDSSEQLLLKKNRIYEKRFLTKLKRKLLLKSQINGEIDISGLEKVLDFDTFHQRFTVPLHGFKDIFDFYEQATCDQHLQNIQLPTLIVNAGNDPLLGPGCFPVNKAEKSPYVYLEVPETGGHVGFTLKSKGPSWMEHRALQFITDKILA